MHAVLLPLDMKKDPVCVSENSATVYAQDGAVNSNGTLPNAFVYIKQGSDGGFVRKDVPPGEYTLAVWTVTFGTQEQKAAAQPGETTTADLTFEGR